jgi:hypothetical protein
MGLFKDEQDVYQVLGTFFRQFSTNQDFGPDIHNSGLIIQFEYTDPAAVITIDTVNVAESEYYKVYEGKVEMKPDVHMKMKADIANKFWLGKLNLLSALSRRQIIAKGPIPKILKLLPAIKPAYAMYQDYLKEIGRTDLLG